MMEPQRHLSSELASCNRMPFIYNRGMISESSLAKNMKSVISDIFIASATNSLEKKPSGSSK